MRTCHRNLGISPRLGRARIGFLATINLCVLILAPLAFTDLLVRVRSEESERQRLEQELHSTRARAEATQVFASNRIRDVEAETLRRLEHLQETLAEHDVERTAMMREREGLVREVAAREEAARISAMGELSQRLSALDQSLENRIRSVENSLIRDREAFQKIQGVADESIYLVHSRFIYRSRDDNGNLRESTGTGWGTAFVVGEEGYLITNKHVCQPWKFDAELSAMEAMGEVEIDRESVILAIWKNGTRCLGPDRDPDFTSGFNTQLKNLRIARTAPDSMSIQTMDVGATTVDYAMHQLDNHDLVLLKADGGSFTPLPIRKPGGTPLAKLDRVMALGFPRGQRGLEGDHAESSPSLGTIRKVEETIHITASIIPGNSGGPVLDLDGRVVGIATRIYSETLGICLKVDHALRLLEDERLDVSLTAEATKALRSQQAQR